MSSLDPNHCQRDVLIIGAGFSGLYLLYKLREHGFRCTVLEAGSEIGGVWARNAYPGSRVDTDIRLYQLSIPELYNTWRWSEKYPGQQEVREYFKYADKVLGIRKNVIFDFTVEHARYDQSRKCWVVRGSNTSVQTARFLLVATGFASKPLIPQYEGMQSFKGQIYHSSIWPEHFRSLEGKRLAIIGTGAAGVQMGQEMMATARSVVVFQRTPNLCLPLRRESLNHEAQDPHEVDLEDLFKHRRTTFGGWADDVRDENLSEATYEERRAFWEECWSEGGFKFWVGNYRDALRDRRANRAVYDFWASKVRRRIPDPAKRDILAPLEPVQPWGVQRPCLETNYYELVSAPNVSIVDVRQDPIIRFETEGIRTNNGELWEADIVALATGYDALTAPMQSLGLVSVDGVSLVDKWRTSVQSYLGMALAGFPNMFFLFSVHSPVASNGLSCIEIQGDWIVEALLKMRRAKITSIVPTREAEKEWTHHVHQFSQQSLHHDAKTWYNGGNVPSKRQEPLAFWGGLPVYTKMCHHALEAFDGFELEYHQS